MSVIPTALDYELRHNTFDPTPPDPERQNLSAEDEALCEEHETYQRWNLSSFTLADLRKNGCLGKYNVQFGDLDGLDIHPVYQRDKWINSNWENVGHGFQGQWDVWGNPQVFQAIIPCIYLASRFLNLCIQSSYWYDGLLFGRWNLESQPSPSDGCPPDHPSYEVASFGNSSYADFSRANGFQQRMDFSVLKNWVLFQIGTGIQPSGTTSFGWHQGNVHGKANNGEWIFNGSNIIIAAESVLPLLKNDLTRSERLVQEFRVATTLLHETMHATGHFAQLINQPPRPWQGAEPFFGGEEIAELGWSWENSFFGGVVADIHDRAAANFHTPALGVALVNWPNYYYFKDGVFDTVGNSGIRYKHPANFGPGAKFCLWPIPTLHLEEVQQAEFWATQVPRFGLKAMQPPILFGSCFTKKVGADGIGCSDMHQETYSPRIGNTDEYQRWQTNRAQMALADGMTVALRYNQIWRDMETARQERLALMGMLEDAMQNNKGDVQNAFLIEVRRLQATNGKCDDMLAPLRGSQIDHIRIQALFLSSRLNDMASPTQRLQWAALSLLEARIRGRQVPGQIDWDLFTQEVEMEVRIIQQEIAVSGL